MAVRSRSSRRWFWLTVLLLGCALAGVQSRPRTVGPASPPADIAVSAAKPAFSLLTSLSGGIRRSWQFVTHIFDLERENTLLRQQLDQAQTNAERLAEMTREVERLRALLGLRGAIGGPTLTARVIGRGPSPWFHTLDLNVGRRDGVRPGCAVVAPDGLVGQVYRVGYNSSKVLCLTDRQGRVGARLQPERVRDVVGVCEGSGDELLTLTYPDPNVDARPGDALVSSGREYGSFLPPGILVGHVVAVEPRPHEASVVITVRPAAELGRIQEALVLLPSDAGGAAG